MASCTHCGENINRYDTHHIKYQSQGGTDDADNLQILCKPCHVKLHSTRGDFRTWGRAGGLTQQIHLAFLWSLKQFNTPEKRETWVLTHKPELYPAYVAKEKQK